MLFEQSNPPFLCHCWWLKQEESHAIRIYCSGKSQECSAYSSGWNNYNKFMSTERREDKREQKRGEKRILKDLVKEWRTNCHQKILKFIGRRALLKLFQIRSFQWPHRRARGLTNLRWILFLASPSLCGSPWFTGQVAVFKVYRAVVNNGWLSVN